MLKAIATFVATKTGWTLGTRLQYGFWGQRQQERGALVAFNAGGRAYFNLGSRRDQQVQVVCRAPSTDYQVAADDAWAVYDALNGRATAGTTLPVIESGETYLVQTIEALALPQYIGPDESGRHQWSVNFTFRMRAL